MEAINLVAHRRPLPPCRGGDSRARRNAADPYRPPLKWCVPVASVVALSERHGQWHLLSCIVESAKSPDLSLRGGRRPTWQSREGTYDFADDVPVIQLGAARLPRQGEREVHQRPPAVELPYTRRSLSAATDAIGAFLFIGSSFVSMASTEIAAGKCPNRASGTGEF